MQNVYYDLGEQQMTNFAWNWNACYSRNNRWSLHQNSKDAVINQGWWVVDSFWCKWWAAL